MRTWTRTAGLLFLAASAAYNGRAIAAGMGKAEAPGSSTGTEVRAVPADEPVASAAEAKPTTKPSSTQPAKSARAAKPAAAGLSEVASVDESAPAAPAPTSGTSVSASKVNYSKDAGTVEIHVNEASLVEVLRMLSMQANTNILPSKDVRGNVTANLYDVTVKEALDAILHANGYGYREKGNVIYVYSAKEIADLDKSDRKMNTEVFHLFYTPAINAQTMIKPVLSTEGQVAVTTPAVSGIESSGKDTGGNAHANEDMMVVTDYPENLDRVRRILKDIDKRPQQILVEATILRAALSEDNALGIDFTLLGGVDFNGLTKNGSSSTDALGGGIVNNSKAGRVVDKGLGGASTGFTQNVPAGGLRAGIITNNVAVFLSALEEVTNTVVMANPKVLVLNKQKGEVKVARQDPFRGKTTTSETGITQQEVDFLETGTLLIFRPYIGDDGYVRLEVHPEDSTPLQSRAADLPPTKLTTETTTNIMVKDGHTVVIGGLFRETSQSSRSQVPGVGNVPLLGNLFKSQADSTQREEVIILLTPHIIKDDSAFAKLSEEQKREAEKLRVGVRRGMMPWGRERLAECEYEKAVAELNKPNPDRHKAIWHLNCATNLNPTFAEAIDLKQKVTGKEVSTVDNSSVRGFVRRMVLEDRPVPAAATSAAPATQPSNTATASAAPTTKPSTEAQASTKEPSDDSLFDEADEKPASVSDAGKRADKVEMKAESKPAAEAKAEAKTESESVKQADASQKKDAAKPAADPKSAVTITEIEELKGDPEPADK